MPSRPASASAPPEFNDDEDYGDLTPQSQDRGMKTKRLVLDLIGRWYWIALGLVLGLLGSAYYLSKAPKKYSATSTLLIKQQTATVMSRDQVEEIDMRTIEGLNTVAERIRRLDLLERVASRVDVRALPGLVPPAVDWRPFWMIDWMKGSKARNPVDEKATSAPPAPQALGGMLGEWMSVSIRRGTRLVDISFEHETPEVARALADAVAREYLAEISASLTEGRASKSGTLEKQSEQVRNELQQAQSALATYNRAIELHKALETQETENAQLARRYRPKHPKMIAAESELNGLKGRFLSEFEVAINATADQSYWKTAGKELESVKDDTEARLRVARQLLLARTGVLNSEITSKTSVFNAMLTRIQESAVNREGEESSADVSSFARVPGQATSPVPKKTYATGGFAGFAAGLLLAFILVRLDNKFSSVAQTEAETHQPVLAAVADIELRALSHAEKSYLKRNKDYQADPLQESWDPRLLFRPTTSSTSFAEMFRILRASISLLGDESKRKLTLFSSALPGEGKSLTSSNFALAAAGQGRRTLLIDLDLRKPSIHKVFGRPREAQSGVTEWLAGQVALEDAIIRDSGAENLHLMLSGKRAPNPGELLNVSRLKRLLAEVCEHYDLVVLDSAPLLAVPDTRVIAPLVDNFCLVVRSNYVPKGAVHRALELLLSADTPPSGLVFNGFKESRRMIGQNYSYGNYRMSRYGRPYQYGYGSHGAYSAYGAYGSDDQDDDDGKQSGRRRSSRRGK